MATDGSDVLIKWGEKPLFWITVIIIIALIGAVVDGVFDLGVLDAVGRFIVQIVDVLKAAIGGMI